jgi:hypothetical protein
MKSILSGALRVTAAIAAALALGAEAMLRGGITAAAHDVEALRAVSVEAREAPVLQTIVRSCRAVLGAPLGAAEDFEPNLRVVREARCAHHVGAFPDAQSNAPPR